MFNVRRRFLTTVLLTTASAFSQSPEPGGAWPNFSAFLAVDNEASVELTDLSALELIELRRVTAKRVDRSCKKVLARDGADTVLRKLSVSGESVTVDGAKALVVEGGADWENSIDMCFIKAHMNVNFWVIDFSSPIANVRLETVAAGHVVLQLSANGLFDIVTLRNGKVGRMELTWWRFNGRLYRPYRCASERYSARAFLSVDPGAQIDKTATISEHQCRPSRIN